MPKTRPSYEKPSQDELARMIASTSISAAARRFCGKRSAYYIIREWCIEYGISIPETRIRRTKHAMFRPTRAILEHMLQTKGTMREVAEAFTVTPTTIYKWMKYFKLRR